LTQAEVEKLKIVEDAKATGDDTIRSLFPKNSKAELALEKTWEARLRLDAGHLKERVLTCKDLKDSVEEKLRELTKHAKYKEFKVAEIKGLPRALVKLDEYIAKRKKKNLPVSSAV
jgi:cell division protein FtsB